jgi:hypothetical protein
MAKSGVFSRLAMLASLTESNRDMVNMKVWMKARCFIVQQLTFSREAGLRLTLGTGRRPCCCIKETSVCFC